MAWVKLDDGYAEHPKIASLSDRAFRLHTAALGRCSSQLTDGHIGDVNLRVLLALTKATKRHVQELVDKDCWHENGDGYVVNDYLDYNPPAATVKKRRKVEAERMRRLRTGART